MIKTAKDISVAGSSFVHLHVHTEYSLLDGASRIKDIVCAAKQNGMKALAITDHGSMYGVIDFYKEAVKEGIKPIIGCEVYVAPKSRHDTFEVEGTRYYHLILLAENMLGYKNLVKLVSLANIEGMYYKPRVDKELLQKYHAGIICLSACIAGEIPQMILRDNMERADSLVQEYKSIFGKDNFFLEIQDHGMAEEKKSNAGLLELAKKHDVGLVATNDSHYTKRADSNFHDVLLCIQMNKTINDDNRMKFPSNEFYLKSPQEMEELFAGQKEALQNTVCIAERCQVDFEFGHLHLPNFPLPEGMTDDKYLRHICEEKIGNRYEEVSAQVRDRLEYELKIIHNMGYDSYFLIVWDFIHYARSQHIAVGPGRGSAAGSIVAYILGITDIDPLRYDLLFERFLNPERVTMPDIDVDFCYMRREEVIDYVKRRYGEDHVAQIVTFGTMAARGAVRDVGRALDMPYASVDKVAKLIPTELGITLDKALAESSELSTLYEGDAAVHRLLDFARDVEGLPRHSSTHAAGVVIARNPLTDYVPVQVSDGTWVTQYDKDHIEELGLLKMDFLGLRTLTVISYTVNSIADNKHITIDLQQLPLKDDLTAKILCAGDTGAIFQLESQGMTNLVRDLQPEGFADLIPLMALYRPGPLGSGMVSDFINGKHGKKQVTYMHPLLEPILRETYGVVLYQEQVMQIVQVLAGFTLGQADLLRRAMGKKKHSILMAQKENFLSGAIHNGITKELAQNIFDLLTHFADYGFNKSHSAAYAMVAWQTAYLKAHYPEEFMAAMLTSIMDNTDKVTVYIEQCRHMGIKILPPDVNASSVVFSVDGGSIRFGLAAVRNVGEAAMKNLTKQRTEQGEFKSLLDFCRRVDTKAVNKRIVENLIKCGAFDSLGAKRAQLLGILEQTMGAASGMQKDQSSGQIGLFTNESLENADSIPLPDVPEVSQQEKLSWEKEITGFYITGHPLDKYMSIIKNLIPISKLLMGEVRDGKLARIAGLVTEVKRITTKKGENMSFIKLEDFTHSIEVVVFPRVFYEYINMLAVDEALVIQGRVSKSENEVKLLADIIWPLSEYRQDYYITINARQEREEIYSSLKKIFSKYHGEYEVYLNLEDRHQQIKTESQFWLDGSDAAQREIEELLGTGAIQQR